MIFCFILKFLSDIYLNQLKLYIRMETCKECKKEFMKLDGLCKHINLVHDGAEIYYKKWLMISDGKCKICGENAKFRNMGHGYNNVCNKKECLYTFKSINLQRGLIKKYGTHAAVYVKDIKEKQENTCLKKYGNKSPLSNDSVRNKIKKSNIARYGCENPLGNNQIRQNIKLTMMDRYGVENPIQNENIHQKMKNTMMDRYGVERFLSNSSEMKKSIQKKYNVDYAQQDRKIHETQQKAGFKIKIFKNTIILYRGSYELDFLEKFYTIYPDLINANSIKYRYKSKNRIYHPDFFIPSLNLIIEIKNSYLLKRDYKIIKAKEKAVINSGFKYIIITDKNYSEFIKLQSS